MQESNGDSFANLLGWAMLIIFGGSFFIYWIGGSLSYHSKIVESVEYFQAHSESGAWIYPTGSVLDMHTIYSYMNYPEMIRNCYKSFGLFSCYSPFPSSMSPQFVISDFLKLKDEGKFFLGCVVESEDTSRCRNTEK